MTPPTEETHGRGIGPSPARIALTRAAEPTYATQRLSDPVNRDMARALQANALTIFKRLATVERLATNRVTGRKLILTARPRSGGKPTHRLGDRDHDCYLQAVETMTIKEHGRDEVTAHSCALCGLLLENTGTEQ